MKRVRAESSTSIEATPSSRPRRASNGTPKDPPDNATLPEATQSNQSPATLDETPKDVPERATAPEETPSNQALDTPDDSSPDHSAPSDPDDDEEEEEDGTEQWGFVVYRTTYSDDAAWAEMKIKLAAFTEDARESIIDSRGDPDHATLKYIEDEATLKDATSQQIRKIFNPGYDPSDDDREPPEIRPDNLCSHVCLMVDTDSMKSILNHSDGIPGYVIAIDANNEKSDQWIAVDADNEESDQTTGGLVPVPWDGTMMVNVTVLWDEFHLRNVGEDMLTMGEIHGDMGKVWEGI